MKCPMHVGWTLRFLRGDFRQYPYAGPGTFDGYYEEVLWCGFGHEWRIPSMPRLTVGMLR